MDDPEYDNTIISGFFNNWNTKKQELDKYPHDNTERELVGRIEAYIEMANTLNNFWYSKTPRFQEIFSSSNNYKQIISDIQGHYYRLYQLADNLKKTNNVNKILNENIRQTGGANRNLIMDYKRKYLKYKTKYLLLKN